MNFMFNVPWRWWMEVLIVNLIGWSEIVGRSIYHINSYIIILGFLGQLDCVIFVIWHMLASKLATWFPPFVLTQPGNAVDFWWLLCFVEKLFCFVLFSRPFQGCLSSSKLTDELIQTIQSNVPNKPNKETCLNRWIYIYVYSYHMKICFLSHSTPHQDYKLIGIKHIMEYWQPLCAN